MRILHRLTKLNEVGTRLRFLTAKQIEEALIGMFPEAHALPFGSSVNGCGKMGCDLDLVLRFTKEKKVDSHFLFFALYWTFHEIAGGRKEQISISL